MSHVGVFPVQLEPVTGENHNTIQGNKVENVNRNLTWCHFSKKNEISGFKWKPDSVENFDIKLNHTHFNLNNVLCMCCIVYKGCQPSQTFGCISIMVALFGHFDPSSQVI